MNVALRKPAMTRDEFLDWAGHQRGRFEFDGFRPVAMTGGTRNHSRLGANIILALGTRLRGGPCEVLGEAGIATIGAAVRYPDALVTCTKGPGTDRLVPGAVVVFEVLSQTSGRTDRVVKVREYKAVSSILRYVLLERTSIGLLAFARTDGHADWTATPLLAGDTLELPEIGVAIPVDEFYENVDLPDDEAGDGR